MKPWSPIALTLFVVAWPVWAGQEWDEQTAFRKAAEYYARVMPGLVSSNLPFADYYKSSFRLTDMGMDIYDDYRGKYARIRGQFSISLDVTDGTVFSVGNLKLLDYVETNSVQRIPQFTVEHAIACAHKYMDVVGMSPPKSMSLSKISFHSDYASCWLLVWEPTVDGFRYDTFFTPDIQQFRICFNERYGFAFCNKRDTWPRPKTTVVKVTKEAAITKASKAFPLIQRSPYYLQCRLPGFVVSGMPKAELLVATPNWLLDPKRAIWLRDKPPEETRLCWVVAFTSVYTGKTEPGELLVPPVFLVYIDAATGEVVGANFT